MKGITSVLLAGLAVFLLCAGCSEKKEIEIAFIGGLTGRFSVIGTAIRDAADLAVREQNGKGGIGGRPLRLVPYDDKGDPAVLAEIFTKLKERKIRFALGPLFSSLAEPLIPLMEDSEILLLSPTISTDLLRQRDDMFIMASPSTYKQGEILADYAAEIKLRKIGIVQNFTNRLYVEQFTASFQENSSQYPWIETEIYPYTESDTKNLQDLAIRIRTWNADGVILATNSIDAALISQFLSHDGYFPRLFGVTWTKAEELITNGGESVEGMIVLGGYEPAAPNDFYREFARLYREAYQTEPSFFAANSYEIMNILFRGLEDAKKPDPRRVKDAILSRPSFRGIYEPEFSFNRYGDSTKSYVLYQVQNGSFVPLSGPDG